MATNPNAGAATAANPLPDNRTPAEKAATSHLNILGKPPVAEDEIQADHENELPKMTLPNDVAKVIEILREVTAEKPASDFEKKIRSGKLSVIRAHLHKIQQGPSAPPMKPDDFRTMAKATSAHATGFRLEVLANEHPIVRELMSDFAALKKQLEEVVSGAERIAALTTDKEGLTAERDALLVENKTQADQVSTLTTEKAGLAEKLAAAASENEAFAKKVADLTEQATALNTQVTTLTEENKALAEKAAKKAKGQSAS